MFQKHDNYKQKNFDFMILTCADLVQFKIKITLTYMVLASCCENNLLYKADPDPDPDLQKKQTLYHCMS